MISPCLFIEIVVQSVVFFSSSLSPTYHFLYLLFFEVDKDGLKAEDDNSFLHSPRLMMFFNLMTISELYCSQKPLKCDEKPHETAYSTDLRANVR